MVEVTFALPWRKILAVRLGLQQATGWGFTLLTVTLAAAVGGPVAVGQALAAAPGPGLMLSAAAFWGASLSGRLPVGYLLAIGWAVADLVLRVIGAFAAIAPLQLADVFAYRWNLAPPWGWPLASAVQGLAGALALAAAVVGVRPLLRRALR